MNEKQYSLYEAKARFSELVRRVRESGETLTITWHGKPVAELSPPAMTTGLEAHLARLEESGELVGPASPVAVNTDLPAPITPVPGALTTFLEERD